MPWLLLSWQVKLNTTYFSKYKWDGTWEIALSVKCLQTKGPEFKLRTHIGNKKSKTKNLVWLFTCIIPVLGKWRQGGPWSLSSQPVHPVSCTTVRDSISKEKVDGARQWHWGCHLASTCFHTHTYIYKHTLIMSLLVCK